jgi:choline dehydrogenase-like flavoprotein
MQHDVASWGDASPFGVDAWRSALATLPHALRTVGEGEWGPMDRALVSACTASGVPRNDALWNDLTSPEGVGAATIFARGGSRSTGVDATLRPAIAAGRVRVERGASVVRLVVRDDVVRGVELATGEVLDARAVILCAGAFGSVEVLQRSALLPKVVRGVQDHPAVALVTREPITQSSQLSIGSIGRLSSQGGVGNIHLVSMNATAPGEQSHGALLVALMDIDSRGSVTYGDDGSVSRDLNMVSTGGEMATLVAALRRIVPIVDQMEERLGTAFHLADRTESIHWVTDSSDAEVGEWVARSCGVYAHAASSLPIGGEHLDRRGALRSVDGVWVADASAMPRLVAGNPTLAIATIARAIAQNVGSATAAS